MQAVSVADARDEQQDTKSDAWDLQSPGRDQGRPHHTYTDVMQKEGARAGRRWSPAPRPASGARSPRCWPRAAIGWCWWPGAPIGWRPPPPSSGSGTASTTSAIAADLAEPDAPARLTAELERRGLAVDVLVNNAGYGVPGLYNAVPWQTHEDFLRVMVTAVCELTHRLLPGMLERSRAESSTWRRWPAACRRPPATRSTRRPRRS